MHCRLLSLAMRQQWTDEDALSCTLLSTNHVYVLCESASKHAVPRCMLRTASVLLDPPAVRYAESCGKCSGCTRDAPRRASTERQRPGTAFYGAADDDAGDEGTLKASNLVYRALSTAVRSKLNSAIPPTFSCVKHAAALETGLSLAVVDYWLKMVLCARRWVIDAPPDAGSSQAVGRWTLRPTVHVSELEWRPPGGVAVLFLQSALE